MVKRWDSTVYLKCVINNFPSSHADLRKAHPVGEELQVRIAQKVADVNRMIEGRFNLINRTDIEELVAERDRITGHKTGTFGKLFGAQSAANAAAG